MQIEAIYDHGRLEFVRPVHFKHDRVRLVIEVPDGEVATSPEQHELPEELWAQSQAMLDKLEAIRSAPFPLESDMPELTPEQLERIEAFELRAQICEEKGRLV